MTAEDGAAGDPGGADGPGEAAEGRESSGEDGSAGEDGPETLRFTPETEVRFSNSIAPEATVQAVHLRDLSFVVDVETDGEAVTACEFDLGQLVRVMILYASMEEHDYDWKG